MCFVLRCGELESNRSGLVAGMVCGFGNRLRKKGGGTLEMGWIAGCVVRRVHNLCVYRDIWRRERVFTIECEKSVWLCM